MQWCKMWWLTLINSLIDQFMMQAKVFVRKALTGKWIFKHLVLIKEWKNNNSSSSNRCKSLKNNLLVITGLQFEWMRTKRFFACTQERFTSIEVYRWTPVVDCIQNYLYPRFVWAFNASSDVNTIFCSISFPLTMRHGLQVASCQYF